MHDGGGCMPVTESDNRWIKEQNQQVVACHCSDLIWVECQLVSNSLVIY